MSDETRRKLEEEKQSLYFTYYLLVVYLIALGLFAQASEEFKETGKLMVQLGVTLTVSGLIGKVIFHIWKICKLDDGKP